MPSESRVHKPVIRVIHHMARTGGTLICRCLASMDNVVLLSEIHPLGLRMFDPLRQAHEWYGLLTEADIASLRQRPLEFAEAILLLHQRCSEQGKHLVLRDWSHLDYTGVPFVRPAFRSLLVEALQSDFSVLQIATVRHPLDQWISLTRQPVFRDKLPIADFLSGALHFARFAVDCGYIRYEDFTREHDTSLVQLCEALELAFDPQYRSRWRDYTNITGDVLPGRAGSEITPLPRQAVGDEETQRVIEQNDYREILRLLNYSGQQQSDRGAPGTN